jgi:hypothetical protein
MLVVPTMMTALRLRLMSVTRMPFDHGVSRKLLFVPLQFRAHSNA